MATVINATFDGTVFRPSEPVQLAPNTLVQLTVEQLLPGKTGEPYSFLDVCLAQKLQGPSDFSENLDLYLYGGKEIDGS